jgi:predicted enzyme related to lactoylglutathione lyase
MTSSSSIVHFEFRSLDLERTTAFYAKALGWQTQPNASSTYMKLEAADGPSTGWVRADLGQAPGPLAYVEVDDLNATLSQVEKAGGRIIVARRPFTGGGEVALFADPDGNVLGLWARKKGEGAEAKPAKAAQPPKATAEKSAAKPAAAAKTAKPAVAKPAKLAKPAKR